jgi:hypothetical protein
MADLVKTGLASAGLDPADVQIGRDAIGIVGTGVDVVWAKDAYGRGQPGWELRTTYHVSVLGSQKAGTATEKVATFGEEEAFQVVMATVMLIVKHKVEAALSQAI